MIPGYQALMLPLLKVAQDGKEHRIGEVVEQLRKQLELSENEANELLPSGLPTFLNRVSWARTYMTQAGLIEATRRSHFRITERGKQVLRENPSKIDVEYLNRFPEFIAFKARGKQSKSSQEPSKDAATSEIDVAIATPDELLRTTIKNLENALSSELLQRILSAPPAFFESLIVNLLLSMGYGGSREEAGRAIGRSGDGGLDGVIDQDPLGLDRVYVQAKRYKPDSAVSEPEIRAFSGSLGAAKANKGVFVTTSYFTKPAVEFAEKHPFKMVLIDGNQLSALMIRHNVGVRVSDTLYVKKVDEDFFLDE
jgi:restriction system protein